MLVSTFLRTSKMIASSASTYGVQHAFGPFVSRSLATKANEEHKAALVSYLLEAKKAAGVSFDTIAKKTGLTNAYVAQLFHRQAQLKPNTAAKLKAAVPTLTDEDLEFMQEIPFRSYDRDVIRTEPLIYRLEEFMLHYGLSIKSLCNEKLGDGIISAIDMYATVDVRKGSHGENRVVVTFDGKWLPHCEQHIKDASPAVAGSSSSGPALIKASSPVVKKAAATGGEGKKKTEGGSGKGRGRPKKERTEEELKKAAEPKKPRGRPKKE